MNEAEGGAKSDGHRGFFRVRRGVFRPRGVVWEELAMGSTNRLWRGRSADGDWLLKWYRYPQSGVHPEVEVAEYLRSFPQIGVAEFGAKIEKQVAGREWVVVGLIQRWVEGRVAWERVLEELRTGEANAAWAKKLGGAIGALHQVLASGEEGGAFCREVWTETDRRAWAKRVEEMGGDLLERLRGERPEGADPEHWNVALERWCSGETQWRARARGLADLAVSGWKSRVHGDLHLGQILETKDGRAIVVDFEGEPMRALAERRAKDVALRDVAGMWRSFAYAGAVSGVGEMAVRELQEAFLDGWREEMDAPEGDWKGLLDGLVWEKAIYELLYEIQHRPAWMGVPLGAI